MFRSLLFGKMVVMDLLVHRLVPFLVKETVVLNGNHIELMVRMLLYSYISRTIQYVTVLEAVLHFI